MLRTQALLAPLILTACAGPLSGCSGADLRLAERYSANDPALQRIAVCPQARNGRARQEITDDETLWDLDNTRLPQHVIP